MNDLNEQLRAALVALLKRYGNLAGSGDAGIWDWEAESEVVAARQALATPAPQAAPSDLMVSRVDAAMTAMRNIVPPLRRSECEQLILAALAAAPAVAITARPTDDELWDATLRDRDTYHEWADKLADAISKYFDAYIGEHSNTNCPWSEALEAIENATPAVAITQAEEWQAKHAAAWGKGVDRAVAITQAATSEPVAKPHDPLFIAAKEWWEGHRPAGYSEADHIANPDVNCDGYTESQLAFVVVAHLSGTTPNTEAPSVLRQIIDKAESGACHGLLADGYCEEIAKIARAALAAGLSVDRAVFESWWEEFAATHEDWQYADSSALRWAAFQAGAALSASSEAPDAAIALDEALYALDLVVNKMNVKGLSGQMDFARDVLARAALAATTQTEKKP